MQDIPSPRQTRIERSSYKKSSRTGFGLLAPTMDLGPLLLALLREAVFDYRFIRE